MNLKFFKNEKTEVDNAEMENTYAMIEDQEIPMSELIENYKGSMEKENEDDNKTMMNEDDEVEVDGKAVKVKELMDAYNTMKENEGDEDDKKNEAEDDKDNEGEEDEDKKNECPAEKKNSKDPATKEAKKNSFKKVKKAFANSGTKKFEPVLNTQTDRLARGSSRYGTVNKIEK